MAAEEILVAEDERIVARDIEKRLTRLGYVVPALVVSGEDAVQKAAELKPDLVLMDIQLRGEMDGIEAAEQIRTELGIPVIYLTAYADAATLQRAKATEPFGYIIKPFDERDLHAAVEVGLRRRLAEAAVRVALEKEKELSELKSRFWSMFAHEFRSPMTTILSAAQLLEQHNWELPEERRREYLYMIQEAVRSMDQLLNDALAIGRAEGGRLKFEPEILDLEQFCRNLVDAMQFSNGQNHQIVFEVHGECSQTLLDKKLLWHILTNLLSNAIKYSPQGGNVYFNLACSNETATLQIRDTGIGIPAEAQQDLFQPFQRATNVGDIPGTGLGLTMVKKCLELHNGQISVESEVDVGTTITVTLFLTPSISHRFRQSSL